MLRVHTAKAKTLLDFFPILTIPPPCLLNLTQRKEGSFNNLLFELQIYPRLPEASEALVIVILEYSSVASH